MRLLHHVGEAEAARIIGHDAEFGIVLQSIWTVKGIGAPVPASLLVLLIVAGFYHSALGLQVVIEDYVHHEGAKLTALIAVNGLSLVLGLTGVLAVLTVLFGG